MGPFFVVGVFVVAIVCAVAIMVVAIMEPAGSDVHHTV